MSRPNSESFRKDVRTGALIALAFGALAIVTSLLGPGEFSPKRLILVVALLPLYVTVGIMLSVLARILRPMRKTLTGELLSAFVLIFVGYGLGALALIWIVPRRPPVMGVVIALALVAFIFAPIYVLMERTLSRGRG